MSPEVNEVLIKALGDYHEGIEDERTREGTKVGMDLLAEDSAEIDEHIKESLRYLRKGANVDPIKKTEPRRRVICDALEAYETGLKESREAYWKKINARPKLEQVDDAISVVQDLRREHCSGRAGLPTPAEGPAV